MKWLALLLIVYPALMAQDAVIRNQEWCARKAQANLKATKEQSPDIAATILSFQYEYSQKHHACVAIMEYKAIKDGHAFAQVLARNVATNQTMKGYAEVYLVPINNQDERQRAVNFLINVLFFLFE
jgi:hypothetical protein